MSYEVTCVTGLPRASFHKLLPRMLLEVWNTIVGYCSPTIFPSNLYPFPLQLHFSSVVLPPWDGSMKPWAPRLANSQTSVLQETLQLRIPPLCRMTHPLPLCCHSLHRIPPRFLSTDPPPCPLYDLGLLIHPCILGKPYYSPFLTLIWSFVANTEPSAGDVLPISKCPTLKDPGQLPPPPQGPPVSQKWLLLQSLHSAR